MPESGGDISKIISDRVESEFKDIKKEALDRFEEKSRELERFTNDLRYGMEQRLKDVEERVTRDVRTRVFSLALSVVIAAAGAMLLGSFTATRDVNNSVIALQKDIISAQTTIKTASDALIDHTKKLAEAQAELTRANGASAEARTKLETTISQLEKVRGDYDRLTKATTDTLLKLETTMSQIDKARSDYDDLAKAIRTVQQTPRQ
jgi:chromosome segregation ATPase